MCSEAGSVNLGTSILACGFQCIQKQEVLILALLPDCVGPAAFRDWKYDCGHDSPSACMLRHCIRGTEAETSDRGVCCGHTQLLWPGLAWSSLVTWGGSQQHWTAQLTTKAWRKLEVEHLNAERQSSDLVSSATCSDLCFHPCFVCCTPLSYVLREDATASLCCFLKEDKERPKLTPNL